MLINRALKVDFFNVHHCKKKVKKNYLQHCYLSLLKEDLKQILNFEPNIWTI